MGSATITHPFHPLHGRYLEALKTRRVSGIETLMLRHPELATFAVPREWTDWGEPSPGGTPDGPALLAEFDALLQLAELVEALAPNRRVDE
ncbi:hypothetical protein A8C75_05460 [Marinobacterium aestuarii]|uniref:Uncharacterized protein n=1 Tax=Marinobacterium aestuarii TaxID=1821621 RepID=A0A1A9EVX0_9GAMM|nr:hypothetical protein A8C75_05460 [Marinobacterium aestuarii]